LLSSNEKKRISRSNQKSKHAAGVSRKKKQWQQILPQRRIPQRSCKVNISYVEKEDDDEDNGVLERFMNSKYVNI
jgi:hypothetical protein